MAKFVQGNGLNLELEKLFSDAEDQILLISPYIKLHERYQSALLTHKESPQLKLIVVFGKNQYDKSRSMKAEDFNFFKAFPNVVIKYEKRLHAKYYSNERFAILTSMNLYSYSQDNNIEAGIVTKSSILSGLTNQFVNSVTGEGFEIEAEEYFDKVVKQSEILFEKIPNYERQNLGLTKKYVSSTIIVDKLSEFFSNSKPSEAIKDKGSYPIRPVENLKRNSKTGYCIRSRKEIPFNTKKPMSEESFLAWAKDQNAENPERFCHFTGEESDGKRV